MGRVPLQIHTNTPQEVQHEIDEQSQSRSQESDIHRLLDPTGNSESKFAGESINWQEAVNQGGDWQEQGPEDERGNWQQSAYDQFNEWRDSTTGDMDGNWQENPVNDWPQETSRNEGVEEDHPQETHEVWHENGMREAVENWSEAPFEPPRMRRFIPVRRVNRFRPPDDDNVYSMELRELLSRRSVSNLLRSGFRESLDQLIQSYVERQTCAPIDWDLHRNLPTPTPASPEQDQEQQRDEHNGDQSDAMGGQTFTGATISSCAPSTASLEREMINDLRADMARLQQGMNHMERMLEACMDMQLELQRSVRQEISAALNRSAGGGQDGWQRHRRMDPNGVMLERELAVFVVIAKLTLFCTDVGTCALVRNVPMNWFAEEGSVHCAGLLLLRLSALAPYYKKIEKLNGKGMNN
ncbi:unnamed protein product [Camellia sinensis]